MRHARGAGRTEEDAATEPRAKNRGPAVSAGRVLDPALGLLLFAGVLLAYLRTISPTVAGMFSDTLELQLVAYQPGIAHPTGYPLYILLGKAFTLLPWGDAAFRVNLMSAFWGAATAALIYATVVAVMDGHWSGYSRAARAALRLAAASGALYLVLSPVFWSQATVAEVYTLNTFFLALLLWVAVLGGQGRVGLAPCALAAGLGLTHHRTFALYLPAVALYLWLTRQSRDRRSRATVRRRAAPLVWLVAPLLLYAYLPLRALTASSLDGTYRNTLGGFLEWVTARAYGTFLSDNPWQQAANPLAAYGDVLQRQFGIAGLALGALGFLWLARKERAGGILLLLCYLSSAGFALAYRVNDADPFYLPSFLVVAVAAGIGAVALAMATGRVAAVLARRAKPRAAGVAGVLVSALLLWPPLAPLPARVPLLDLSHDREVRAYGEDVLSQPLGQGAAIVGLGGEITLLRYLQETERRRPDLLLVRADDEGDRLSMVEHLLAAGMEVYVTRPLAGLPERHSLAAQGPLVAVRPAPVANAAGCEGAPRASFAGEASLKGVSLGSPATAGDKLRVSVCWEAGATRGDRFVFVHVADGDGQTVAQLDARPVGGAYPTTYWRGGETIADVYDVPLPVGLPPGEYAVAFGMYDAPSGARLETRGGDGESGTSLDLGRVRVERDRDPPPPSRRGHWDWSGSGPEHDGVRLVGALWDQQPVAPGRGLTLTTLWEVTARSKAAGRMVGTLRAPSGNVAVEQVWSPAGGRYPTTDWQKGELVRLQGVIPIPPALADGTYRLEVGMQGGRPVFAGTVAVRGRARVFAAPKPAYQVGARLGEVATLVGFDAPDAGPTGGALRLNAGQDLRLVLYWRAEASAQASYKVFVHLVSPAGVLLAQHDAEPASGEAPATSWLGGEYVADGHTLAVPRDAAPGEATLVAGLYDAASGKRLTGPAGDAVVLAKVVLE